MRQHPFGECRGGLTGGFSGRFRHSVADFPAVHKLFVEKDMISAFFEKRKEVF